MAPMVSASGVPLCVKAQIARPATNTPNTSMLAPLSSAARARQASAIDSTTSDTA